MSRSNEIVTSGTTPDAVMTLLFGLLGSGVVLNLGSGQTGGATASSQIVVNADLRKPPGHPPDRFVRADAAWLPFRDSSFASVLAKDVVEHVDDVLGVLLEVARVTRPDGALVLTVPRAIPRAVWADVTHRRGFTGPAIDDALRRTGWSVLSRHRIGGFPGAGRLGLERHLVTLMRIPGFGHRYGLNWLVRARRAGL